MIYKKGQGTAAWRHGGVIRKDVVIWQLIIHLDNRAQKDSLKLTSALKREVRDDAKTDNVDSFT